MQPVTGQIICLDFNHTPIAYKEWNNYLKMRSFWFKFFVFNRKKNEKDHKNGRERNYFDTQKEGILKIWHWNQNTW